MRRIFFVVCLLFLVTLSIGGVRAQCPEDVPPGHICDSGRDENGAYFLIVVPDKKWNEKLVIWNHGHSLDPPRPLRFRDIPPGGIMTGQCYAVAASSFRPDRLGFGGWAVRDGAEDTDNLRKRFEKRFGKPEQTYIVGESMGSLVTVAMMELYGRDEKGGLNYHGALSTCGLVGGGRRNWYGGLDLRVVYQFYCCNLPRPEEPAYDLFLGLHPQNQLSPREVLERINECTGISLPPDERSKAQQQNLDNILAVAKIPGSSLIEDMSFATFALQELTMVRTNGKNPLTNIGVQYTGSDDDAALNAGVTRWASDPEAVEFIVSAYDPQGTISAPIVTMHAIDDGLAVVENENAYLQTLRKAGTDHLIQQNYVQAQGHCVFSLAEILASFQALTDWVEKGEKPTRQSVDTLCREVYQPKVHGLCRADLDFEPGALETRIPDRTP